MIYNYQIGEINQGDIFKGIKFNCDDDNTYPAILLTPRCDLVVQKGKKKPKAHFLKFSAIIPADFILENILSTLRITKNQRRGEEYIDGETYKDFIHLIKNFLTGSIYQRYFYIWHLKQKAMHHPCQECFVSFLFLLYRFCLI